MVVPSRETNPNHKYKRQPHGHFVQFSQNDASLIDSVCVFISAGLRAGEGCLVVATQAHRECIEQRLEADGFDIALAQATGSYLPLDAAETLARFLVAGQLEPASFVEVIGGFIAQMASTNCRVRIFGEMVALLWAEGKRTTAIQLEELWNDLGEIHAFKLFCAYPIQQFGGKAYEAQFTQICQQHSQVIPPENHSYLSEQERQRASALLQQKALSLEIEVAERKAEQERLRILAAIVESSNDAILSKDLSGIITSWNSGAAAIYGYSPQEIIGQPVTVLFPPDHDEEFHRIMARIRGGKSVDHYETRRMRKDGTIITVSVTISPIKDEDGKVIGASSIARDITEKRQLEAKSQRLFASNLIGIFVADEAGTLLQVNQAFLEQLGYTQEEWLAGAVRLDGSSSPISPLLRQLVLQVIHENSSHADPQEMVLRHKSGKDLSVLVAITCIEYSETCIGFVLDISERKALEQRKDAFIGIASHELKTPVTSLKGFLSLLRRRLASQENEAVQHYLTRMDAQIDKLTALINDLLDLSRIQTGYLVYRKEQVELDALIQEVIEGVQETTRTHHLRREGQTQAEVFGDRDRLGQVVINLLNNAIKYSPNANSVVVHLSVKENQALVSVQDFGLGIAKAHHHKIFERFYQVSDPEGKTHSGLGIGLSISHEIVKRHGGDLWVESEKGKGATFHMSLPLIQPLPGERKIGE